MKTSNKILLGILLLPLLIIAAINMALYAKYKSGHYVAMSTVEQDRFTRQTLKNINYVALYGINNCTIKPADTAKLEIEKDEHGHLHYSIHGDSLIIHGDSTVRKTTGDDIIRSYQSVNLYLSGKTVVTADNSDVYIEGGKDSTKANSYQFQLSNSTSCKMQDNDFGDSVLQYFNVLAVQANGSSAIELSRNARIKQLSVALQDARFDDKDAVIGNFTVDADKASTLTLKGDNLKKIKP
jgi:hypothetical protein